MKMKAVIRTKFGLPKIKIKKVEKPTPKDKEVLIKVYAATVNRTDCAILFKEPFLVRYISDLFKPKYPLTGTDFAGKVEAVGKGVKSFKVGDRVWGFDDEGLGSHAQYITVSENKALTTIPDSITYQQAAASAEGVHYAYNFVNKIDLKSGQNVLVNGATGAIGSAAVQILKSFDVNVTAVCDGKNTFSIKSMGADRVIDYTKEEFTNDKIKYDYVFDAVGKSSFEKCKPLLTQGGAYISSELGYMGQNLFLALFTPLFSDKKVIFPYPTDIKKSIGFVKKLIKNRKFRPLIDKRYPFEEIYEAYNYVASGKKIGNVVITMGD
ncbi:MAG: NAD(P)-dependent alcohol dehydrogenase [Bacteroidota bacterium]